MDQMGEKVTGLRTIRIFLKKGACSTTLCQALDRGFGHPLEDEEDAALPLAGGIVPHGYQCGQIWGAALAAGAQAHQSMGAGAGAQRAAIIASGRLVERFRARYRAVNCLELTRTDWSKPRQVFWYMLRGGPARCFIMAGTFAPHAFADIETAVSEVNGDPPTLPVGCAALLAGRAGASDLHTSMAAGLAGGIGLSGGACGALGAAIWLRTLVAGSREPAPNPYDDPHIKEIVAAFLSSSGGVFECAKICGRKFTDVHDHTAYVREGGCAGIIETLASVIGGGGNQAHASSERQTSVEVEP